MSTSTSFKKARLPRYLDNVPVYNIETGIKSDFFNTRNLSEFFMLGKNSFFIGGSDKLQQGTEVAIEVTDSLGNVVYTEYPNYKEDNSVLASVFVYDDTASGLCDLVLLGIAKDVPDDWKGVINTKWKTQVYIDPTRPNKDSIRFITMPSASFTVAPKQFYTSSISLVSKSISIVGGRPTIIGNTLTMYNNFFIPQMVGATIEATVQLVGGNFSGITFDPQYTSSIYSILNPRNASITTNGLTVYIGGEKAIGIANILSGIVKYYDIVYTPTTITSSIITVDAINLDTFTGKVDKIYIYKKSLSKLEDYTLHSIVNVNEANLLSVEDLLSVNLKDIGIFTNEIIEQNWQSHRQMYSDGTNADRIIFALPVTAALGSSYRVHESMSIILSSSTAGIIETYTAASLPLSGTFQFSGSTSVDSFGSAQSLVYIINSGSNYLTASYIAKADLGTIRPVITLSIRDSYTASFDDWYVTQSGQPVLPISGRIVNMELFSASLNVDLKQKFPTPSGSTMVTSSGFFLNAAQVSESYFSNHYPGAELFQTTSSLKLYCYKVFYPQLKTLMYTNTEYIHSSYIAGYGELEVRMVGNAIRPDNMSFPGLGSRIAHFTNTTLVNYGHQSQTFTADFNGVGNLLYIVKSGIWNIGNSYVAVNIADGYSPSRNIFRFPIVPLSTTEIFKFKLLFANPENTTNIVEIESPNLTCTGGTVTVTSGGGINFPISPEGSVIFSDGHAWRPATPITGQSGSGWLVNAQGILIVNYLPS